MDPCKFTTYLFFEIRLILSIIPFVDLSSPLTVRAHQEFKAALSSLSPFHYLLQYLSYNKE